MKRLGLSLALLSVPFLQLHAASVWSETAAAVDERVADTQTLAPIDLMKPAFAQIPFANFRYPHVDKDQDVTFIADDPVFNDKAAQHHGVYRSMGKTGELRALMRQGEPVPWAGDAKFKWFRGLQVDGEDFVINATDTGHERGLYHYSKGNVTLIARTHVTSLPGVTHPLTGIEYGSLKDGRILYSAHAAGEALLVLHDLRTKQARVICRSGVPVPGQPGEQFHYFSTTNWIDHTNIVFRGASVSDPHGKDKASAGRYGVYGWFGIDWAHPDKSLDPSRLVAVADGKSTVPLLDASARFNDFRSAPVRDGLIVFNASGGNAGGQEFNGVYYCDLKDPGGAVHPIVDTESSLKGLFSGHFSDFDIYCTVFDKSVVFVGRTNDGYEGVFLYRTDRDELFVLTDNRQPLEGKEIESFEIAGDFLVGNRFAVTLRLSDGKTGVYMATIPVRSFKRMTQSDSSN